MNNILPELTRTEAKELVDEQRKEYRLIGSAKRIHGLILFEYDLTTGELRRASMKKEVALYVDGRIGAKARVDKKELCLYVQALNQENALRKVKQLLKRNDIRNNFLKQQKNGK